MDPIMFTSTPDKSEAGERIGRTFVWNEPDSPGQISSSSSQTSTYLFTRTALRTPRKGSQRPSTPLPVGLVTPREITARILPGQIQPGGRGPVARRGLNRSEPNLFQPKRQFIFEDIDESTQEEIDEPSVFSPSFMGRNSLQLSTPASITPDLGFRQRTKTFIFDDDSVQQISDDGQSRRPPSVESISLNDPRSPLLTSREAQKLCLGKSEKRKKGFTKNIGAVKGVLFCQCNCSNLRTKNRVGCLSDQYEEM